VLYEAGLSTRDKALIFKAVQSGLDYLNENFHEGASGTDISTGIHRKVYGVLKDDDPYKEIKAQSNAIAARMMPSVRKHISMAPQKDRFRLAVLASIIGNNFDFGLQDEHDGADEQAGNAEHYGAEEDRGRCQCIGLLRGK